jgi:hypothetical protein
VQLARRSPCRRQFTTEADSRRFSMKSALLQRQDKELNIHHHLPQGNSWTSLTVFNSKGQLCHKRLQRDPKVRITIWRKRQRLRQILLSLLLGISKGSKRMRNEGLKIRRYLNTPREMNVKMLLMPLGRCLDLNPVKDVNPTWKV